MIDHPIAPVYNEDSKILILGSFPSVRSRETEFFYGHPQNRFWRVVSALFNDEEPQTTEQKKDFLLRHGVALWDVIASCDITGSADSSIRNVKPNDISLILSAANIEAIFVNGRTAEKYYDKYLKNEVKRSALLLPSTSPANAKLSLPTLIERWKEKILPFVR